MASTMELPVWVIAIVGGLAAIALIDRMLMPGVRFVLRRRLERAIDRLNQKLQLRIQPFKLARRRVLLADPGA